MGGDSLGAKSRGQLSWGNFMEINFLGVVVQEGIIWG